MSSKPPQAQAGGQHRPANPSAPRTAKVSSSQERAASTSAQVAPPARAGKFGVAAFDNARNVSAAQSMPQIPAAGNRSFMPTGASRGGSGGATAHKGGARLMAGRPGDAAQRAPAHKHAAPASLTDKINAADSAKPTARARPAATTHHNIKDEEFVDGVDVLPGTPGMLKVGRQAQVGQPHRAPAHGHQTMAHSRKPPAAPLPAFKVGKDLATISTLVQGLNATQMLNEAIHTTSTLQSQRAPSWDDVTTRFEAHEAAINDALQYFNSIVERANQLVDIKTKALDAKQELTAQYREGGAQLALQCNTLQSSTHQIKLPDAKRRREA